MLTGINGGIQLKVSFRNGVWIVLKVIWQRSENHCFSESPTQTEINTFEMAVFSNVFISVCECANENA